ncbi:MAG: hypothetical protein NTY38_21515, partial [Acidobacteria bacterium]|nr:hypothetical protein [Acidobacteriota bacterium]
LLETNTPMRGQNLSPQLVATLPLFAGGVRSAESFVAYMPGVNTIGEVSVNGSIGRAKEILIDGGSLTLPESGGVVWYFPGFESFQEFKLVTSSFNAEHGRLGGGLELFVTKSGTNGLHGAGFLNLRRDIFNAAGWSVNHIVGRTPGFRPKERFNEEGFTVGGPVYIPKLYDGRNRTFFFVTYDKDVRPVSLNPANGETLPTMLMRTGNFSEVSAIYDPTTTSGGTRTPFANNQIPVNRFSSISNKMLSAIPATNRAGISANYDFLGATKLNDYVATVKLDHSFTPSNRLAFWMARRNQVTSGEQYMPGVLSNMVDVINDPWWYRVNHDLILSPSMLLHTTFSFTKDRNAWDDTNQAGYGSKAGFSTTGVADATPYITWATDNLQWWGNNQGKVKDGYQQNWTTHVSEQLSWTRGKREFKMGWDIRRMRTIDNYSTYQNGQFNFSRVQTASPTALGSTGNAFASFLLGAVNSGTQMDKNYTTGQIRYGYHAGFWQDTWRMTPRFTLDYGIRYEVPIGWHMADGNYSSLDPALANAAAGGLPGALIYAGDGAGRTGKKRLYPTDLSNIGPRLGFAYRLREKTVLRGGYGIYYQPQGNGGCGSAAGTGGCTDGINGTYTSTSDGTNAAFFWDDTRGVPQPLGYKAPPRIDPTFVNFGNSVYYQGDNYGKAPRIYNWSFTIQHEYRNWLFETAYVGNRGHGLNSTTYMNQLPTAYLSLGSNLTTALTSTSYPAPFSSFVQGWGKSATVAQSLRPFPQYGNVYSANSGVGKTWYDSLQSKVERRFGDLNLMASYVFSKSLAKMTYRQIFNQGTNVQTQDSYNLNDAKTLMYMDVPNYVNIVTSYQLPFGKGRKFLSSSNRAFNLAVGGWVLSGTGVYRSGGLIQVVSATNQLATTIFAPLQKATPTGSPVRSGISSGNLDPDVSTNRWFNYGASAPYVNTAAYTLGTASIYDTHFRNPWYRSENLSISKTFAIWESARFIYRADAFNVFNRTAFGGINGTIGNANYGRATGAQVAARVVTMGLRAEF